MVAVIALRNLRIRLIVAMNVSQADSRQANQFDGESRVGIFQTIKGSLERLSLVKRMFISSGLVLIIFLSSAALVLNTVFAISLDSVVQEKLKLYTYQLISIGDSDDGAMRLPKQLSEPRFNEQQGSLMGFVTELTSAKQQQEVWRSQSATDKQFSFSAPESGEWFFSRAQGDNGVQYYVSSYNTTWSNDIGLKTKYVFTVIEDFSYYQKELSKYQTVIIVTLLVFGLIFLLLQTIILRFGLSPVRKITADVEAMNKGELDSLTGQYPKELKPLTTNLNQLIDNERYQRERYRNRMADLSHSLKTPLSVLKGVESDIDSQGQPIARSEVISTLTKHVNRMSEIVDHQLQRAIPNNAPRLFSSVDVAQGANDIILALNKVYANKKIKCELNIENGLSFYGDKNDLIEIMGNLLDNAYKHGTKLVRLSAVKVTSVVAQPQLILRFEDDGCGIPLAKRSSILERGVRLDSSGEGQGFGLSIVADIVNNYHGGITIENSVLGGAMFNITMPTR